MALSTSDALIFRNAVKASVDPTVVTAYANGDIDTLATYYNQASNPAVALWKNSIKTADLNTAIVWSEFAGLTTAQQQTYMAMITVGTVDATNSNIRSGFSTIFSGKTSLTNLTAMAQLTGTRFQTIAGYLSDVGPFVSTQFGILLDRTTVSLALYNPDGSKI